MTLIILFYYGYFIVTIYTIIYAAPSAPPVFQAVDISARNATLIWNPPPEDSRNGNIVRYTLSCTDASNSPVATYVGNESSITVTNLTPDSTYTCSITASTNAGESSPGVYNFTTMEDGIAIITL